MVLEKDVEVIPRKIPEEITGSSSLQSELIIFILDTILSKYDRKEYKIHTNESGLQLGYKDTLAGDILVYDRKCFNSR